jgi:phosphomannomutase
VTTKDVARAVRRARDVVHRSAVIKPFNVVLDAGSGMGGLVAPKLFERLPCRTTRLCFEIDGRFPNHEANPLIEENRRDIVERVVAEKADIGIAWDGDADRCFFIDGTGEFVSGDFVTALLAEAFLIKHPARRSSTICARATRSRTSWRGTAARR